MLGIIDYVPEMEMDSKKAFLNLLMISRTYGNTGVGREAVMLVEKDMVQNKAITHIESGVQVNNPDAIRFWNRMGYATVSGPELLPDGTKAYSLSKRICR